MAGVRTRPTQYSPATTSSEVATRSLVWAERLVQAMEAVLTRPM
ncbi:hypothetical protein ACMA46_06450 [Clavibacter sp. Sh2141]